MKNQIIIAPVNAERLLDAFLMAGVTHDQLNAMTSPEGEHIALRAATVLDPEPPYFSLDDFADAVNDVASRHPATYLLFQTFAGSVTTGHLSLGPVEGGEPGEWPLASFHRRLVLRFQHPLPISACIATVLHPLQPHLRAVRYQATPITRRVAQDLPQSVILYRLTPRQTRSQLVIER